MKLYRFSPIKDKVQLFKAIEYIHLESFRLCKLKLGLYLPVVGNIGVFCHYDEEYERLNQIRKELTDIDDNWNHKYFRLHKPIVMISKGDVPETTYTYLYIRKPDPYRHHVGDVDFYLKKDKYQELKKSLISGKGRKGIRLFERPTEDMIELFDPDSDLCAYIHSHKIGDDLK